jgi:Zn-dependent membrane protease YugP
LTSLLYLVIGAGFLFSLLVQGWLRATYARWSRVRNSLDLPGAEVSRRLLDRNGMPRYQIEILPGQLTDHFDPRSKTVALSQRIFREPSVASAAVAAHETGHALQDHTGYGPMQLRYAVLPLAHVGARFGPWAVLLGWFAGSDLLLNAGFLMFAAALGFQLLSLPIEFDASRRARDQLRMLGMDSLQDLRGTRQVLRAAAMTYVANSATAMGQLLVILLIAGRGLWRRLLPLAKKPPAA